MSEIRFAIGGKQFSYILSGSYSLSALSGAYEQFFINQGLNGQESITRILIHFHRSRVETENYKNADEVFCIPGWRLLKTGTEYFIVSTAFARPGIFWVARSGLDFKDIQVWCNDCFIPDQQLPREPYYVEFVLRLITRLLLMYDMLRDQSGLLFHTAALRLNGRIWLFAGCSGAGKSTFSRLWLDRTDAHVVNDERMIVRQDESESWPRKIGRLLKWSFCSNHRPFAGPTPENRDEKNEKKPLGGLQGQGGLGGGQGRQDPDGVGGTI